MPLPLSPPRRNFAITLSNLAETIRALGKLAEAEELYRKSIGILEKQTGPPRLRLAISLNNLAELYSSQGRYGEAERLLIRAVAMEEAALGPDHLNLGVRWNSLGTICRAQGRYAEAVSFLLRSLSVRERALGAEDPKVAVVLGPNDEVLSASQGTLAEVYRRQGRYNDAEGLLKGVLSRQEQRLGPDHPELPRSMQHYAGLLKEMKRKPEAKAMLARAHEIERRNSASKAFRQTVDTVELGLEGKTAAQSNPR